jgi:hypothetical protein
MLTPEFHPSAAPTVDRVKRLRMRANVLFFAYAISVTFLPLTIMLAFEPGMAATASACAVAFGLAAWFARQRSRRDREEARDLEEGIRHLVINQESQTG